MKMNTKRFTIYAALLGFIMAFAACQPEEFSLGTIISKENLKYSITQNASDPNMVILESQTPGVTPLWVTPAGRSTKIKDTVKIAFPGDYKFVYGVESAGGFVQADTMVISITTTNLSYVDDPLWNMLTGGVGNSKTWILDNGKLGLAPGPLSYADPSVTQEWGNYTPNWEPSGSDVSATDQDYAAEMTFDLIGGPHLTSYKPNEEDVTENGVFDFNVDNHTLSTTDATIIRLAGFKDNAENWTTGIKVLELTEDQLRIAIMRTNDEGPWYYIFNYVSKEYADNYVPSAEPEPPYSGNPNSDLTTSVSTSKTWVVDLNYPYNWHNLAGNELNEVATTADQPEGFTFTTWTPPYDEAAFSAVSMTMTKGGDSDGTYEITIGSDTYNGNYTIDEKNNIDFGQPITFFSGVGGWLTFGTTAKNTLRIIKTEKDLTGNIKGIWLGQRSSTKDEYLSLHLAASSSGGGSNEPQGTEIAFDNAKLDFGDLEGKGNLRLELYNAWGVTANDPPLDAASVVFSNRIAVTFTLQGITLNDGSAGSYPANIGFADADWSAQYWGGGDGDVSVTGDGTYTVWAEPGVDSEGLTVFVIDIVRLYTDISDMSTVTATIDKVVTY